MTVYNDKIYQSAPEALKKKVKFIYFDGHDNAIVTINQKNYRWRGEVLIYNDDNEIYMAKRDYKGKLYTLPGGTMEKMILPCDNMRKETQEEAGLDIGNIVYTGEYYIYDYEEIPEWHKIKLHPYGLYYHGDLSDIFVAHYKCLFKGTKNIHDYDLESHFRKVGKFYKYEDIKNLLTKPHDMVIKKFILKET